MMYLCTEFMRSENDAEMVQLILAESQHFIGYLGFWRSRNLHPSKPLTESVGSNPVTRLLLSRKAPAFSQN